MEKQCVITTLEEYAVFSLLVNNDNSFIPPISQSIDIQQYALKLAKHAQFVICSEANTYVGMIAFYTNIKENQIYIPYVHVSPNYRRQGIAEYMFNYLQQNISGYDTMALEVRKENKAACDLYKKLNFKLVEKRGEKYLMVRFNKIN